MKTKRNAKTMMDFLQRWDDEVGLFRIAPDRKGHTIDCFGQTGLHSLPDSVSFMTFAAQTGRLRELDCLRILQNLKKCQYSDAARHGQIKWYLEDRQKSDGNAPFFICVGLIPLKKLYAHELGPEAVTLLDQLLTDTLVYFMHKVETGSCYYPNSFMGDLLFAWLLNEVYGDQIKQRQILLNMLKQCGEYWVEKHWGWGEHMSDNYSVVCCFEISMLLLLSKTLPEDLRALFERALQELLEIEDSFGGKPRVPVIRSYAFDASPQKKTFRSSIREWAPDEEIKIGNLPPIGPLLHRLGWEKMAPPQKPARSDFEVACYNDSRASSYILEDFRIGGMTRYPVMDTTAYLQWQSFPVAFLHQDGDWGFLQWCSEEDGVSYAHPSLDMNYGIDRGLSLKVRPPLTGKTYSIRQGGNLIVLRRMPSVSMAWTRFADRLRVIAPTAVLQENSLTERCSTLRLNWPGGRFLSVARVTFSAAAKHQPAKITENKLDWDLEYRDFPEMNDTVTLWAFSVDAEITEAPEFQFARLRFRPWDPENRPFELRWQAGRQFWHVEAEPVQEIFRLL